MRFGTINYTQSVNDLAKQQWMDQQQQNDSWNRMTHADPTNLAMLMQQNPELGAKVASSLMADRDPRGFAIRQMQQFMQGQQPQEQAPAMQSRQPMQQMALQQAAPMAQSPSLQDNPDFQRGADPARLRMALDYLEPSSKVVTPVDASFNGMPLTDARNRYMNQNLDALEKLSQARYNSPVDANENTLRKQVGALPESQMPSTPEALLANSKFQKLYEYDPKLASDTYSKLFFGQDMRSDMANAQSQRQKIANFETDTKLDLNRKQLENKQAQELLMRNAGIKHVLNRIEKNEIQVSPNGQIMELTLQPDSIDKNKYNKVLVPISANTWNQIGLLPTDTLKQLFPENVVSTIAKMRTAGPIMSNSRLSGLDYYRKGTDIPSPQYGVPSPSYGVTQPQVSSNTEQAIADKIKAVPGALDRALGATGQFFNNVGTKVDNGLRGLWNAAALGSNVREHLNLGPKLNLPYVDYLQTQPVSMMPMSQVSGPTPLGGEYFTP